MSQKQKEKIKACIAFIIIVIIVLIAGTIILKYQIEGEGKNMPFILSNIYLISSAEGVANEGTQERWNINIYQNNDIYFNIEKNKNNKKEEKIKSVEISNIQIIKRPNIGNIKIYMPNSSDGRLFSYEEDFILQKDSLTYNGATKTDTKKLEIGNQGGTISIRFSNPNIATYISDDDIEIQHDGTMLQKINISNEDLKCTVQFDFIINLENKSYKTTMQIDMPTGDITQNGKESIDLTGNYIFKRM